MKNIGACLFIAFAILLQFQVSIANDKIGEDLETIVFRREYSWLMPIAALIQIFTFAAGYKDIEDKQPYCMSTRLHNKFKKCVDLFKQFELIVKRLEKLDDMLKSGNITVLNELQSLMEVKAQRKREFNIEQITRSLLALSNTRAEEDDVFNVELIDTTINRNVNLFTGKKHYESSDAVEFSKTGFECTQEFCDEHGNGVHALGVCFPLFCACSNRGAEGYKCPDSLIFDPVHGNCVNPKDAKICGFR